MPLRQPVLRRGVSNAEAVKRLQQRLNEVNCGPLDTDVNLGFADYR